MLLPRARMMGTAGKSLEAGVLHTVLHTLQLNGARASASFALALALAFFFFVFFFSVLVAVVLVAVAVVVDVHGTCSQPTINAKNRQAPLDGQREATL